MSLISEKKYVGKKNLSPKVPLNVTKLRKDVKLVFTFDPSDEGANPEYPEY